MVTTPGSPVAATSERRRPSAEILIFLNSDAVLRPGAIEALVEALQDPSVGIVGGACGWPTGPS